ncbi:MAG: MlaD family protein [Methylophagaceae bacterium]
MFEKNNKNQGIEVRHIDRIVGVFIIGAIIIALAGWFLRLHGLGDLEEKLPFHTILSESFGLAPAAEIDLAGITIGMIKNVTLQDDGHVRVDIEFIKRYKKFLTVGSQLEIEPTIGVQSILGGGGLIFHFNSNETQLLALNSQLEVIEPVDLAAQIEAFDLPGLAKQIKAIVYNVEQLTGEQGALFAALNNVSDITDDLAKSTSTFPSLMANVEQQIPQIIGNVEALTSRLEKEQVPQILGSVENNLASLQTAMDSVSGILTDSEDDIKAVMANAAGATDQLNKATADLNVLLAELQSIVKDVSATTEQLPGVLSRSEDLIDNSVELTDKLNNHWLLGGNGDVDDTVKSWPSIHSIDDSPYDEINE